MSGDNLKTFSHGDRVIQKPARLLITTLLAAVKEADFLYLQRESGLTKGNLSSHLLKLELAGYIQIQKTFHGRIPLIVVCVTRQGRMALEGYKKKMKGLLLAGEPARRKQD